MSIYTIYIYGIHHYIDFDYIWLLCVRLETKSCRILPLTYGKKCDMT